MYDRIRHPRCSAGNRLGPRWRVVCLGLLFWYGPIVAPLSAVTFNVEHQRNFGDWLVIRRSITADLVETGSYRFWFKYGNSSATGNYFEIVAPGFADSPEASRGSWRDLNFSNPVKPITFANTVYNLYLGSSLPGGAIAWTEVIYTAPCDGKVNWVQSDALIGYIERYLSSMAFTLNRGNGAIKRVYPKSEDWDQDGIPDDLDPDDDNDGDPDVTDPDPHDPDVKTPDDPDDPDDPDVPDDPPDDPDDPNDPPGGGGDTITNITNNNTTNNNNNSVTNNTTNNITNNELDLDVGGPGVGTDAPDTSGVIPSDWQEGVLELPDGALSLGSDLQSAGEGFKSKITSFTPFAGLTGGGGGSDLTSVLVQLPKVGTVTVNLPLSAPGIPIFRACCLFALYWQYALFIMRCLKV